MARRRHPDYFDFPPQSVPKEVKGGIKAQTKRGAFTEQWWGKRWVEVLESFRLGARLSRGRSYARKGQVVNLNVECGAVTAEVQGSRAEAYRVTIQLRAYTKEQWNSIVEQIAEQPLFAAQLLGNEMPEEIEAVFRHADLPLFPEKKGDLATECSCPDSSNPCKHIAAVLYLMGEALDRDPFLLFQLRGMERDTFLEELRTSGATEDTAGEDADETQPLEPEPLPADSETFWGTYSATHPAEQQTPPRLHANIPKRMGSIPFWRSQKNFIEQMTLIYERAADHAAECSETSI